MNYEQKFIEIPFGAKDSELKGWEYTIPEGMEAIVKDGKIIVKEKESEDERIRKAIIDALYSHTNSINVLSSKGYSMDDVIAYLEEREKLPFVKDVVLGLPGIYFYDGERMHFQGSPATEENPYDFAMSQQEKQKEQKPISFNIPYNPDDYEVVMEGNAISLKRKEQKPDEDSEYRKAYLDGWNARNLQAAREQKPDLELIQRSWYMDGYIDGEFKREPRWNLKIGKGGPKSELNPKYGQPLEQKEWSEEDEDMLNSCISSIEEAKENRYAYKETDGDTSYDHEIAWLKSLRPSWKPSENQMSMLLAVVNDPNNAGSESCHLSLESLYNDLKKL